jgi:protein arginine kinase activator
MTKMKCQKCGKNEVNFHYSSNVNGCVTETHLCSQCAAESGYDMERMFDRGFIFDRGQFGNRENIFDLMLPMHGGIGGFMPLAIPVMQPNAMIPFTLQRRSGTLDQGDACGCGCGKSAAMRNNTEVDADMSKRRELNMQMRAAVEREEFEKAAELRDQIKELEASAEASGSDQQGKENGE